MYGSTQLADWLSRSSFRSKSVPRRLQGSALFSVYIVSHFTSVSLCVYACVILYNTAHTHTHTHTHTHHTNTRTHLYIILFSLHLSLSPSHCLSHRLSSLDVVSIHAERESEREMWCERVFDNESKRGCVYIYGNSWHHSLEALSPIFRQAFPQVSDLST
jgi:hypothetical protein